MAYIPDDAIDQLAELSKGARHLYVFLARCRNQKSGRCFPSVTTTQEALDINRSSVFALRQELIEKDWARFAGDHVIWLKGFNEDSEMPAAKTSGIVYVLTDGAGHYKIGQTTDLAQRIRSLSTGMPMELTTVISYLSPNVRSEERRWHKIFVSKRLKGEWYALSEEELNIIRINAESPENQTSHTGDTQNDPSPENQTITTENTEVTESPENQTEKAESRNSDSESRKSCLKVQKIVSESPEIQTACKEEPAKEPAKITSKEEQDMSGATAPTDSVPPEVREVFSYWQNRFDHQKSKLTPKRLKAIKGRLGEKYTVEEIKLAIDGCASSPWYMGANDRQTIFDDIELICRTGEKLESFIAKVQSARPATLSAFSPAAQRTIAAGEEFIRHMQQRGNS